MPDLPYTSILFILIHIPEMSFCKKILSQMEALGLQNIISVHCVNDVQKTKLTINKYANYIMSIN